MADLTSRLIMTLVDHVTAPARGVARALGGVEDRIAANNAAIAASTGQLIGAVAGAAALGAAISRPVSDAMAFESAMADVTKVVDFSEEGLANFRDELFRMSREIPITVEGLTQIAAAAGQAGIAGDDLLRFTEAAAKVGTAFDISADEAGAALAKMMTATGSTLDEVILLTDAMNHLSNAQASGADEILDVVRRVGAQGTQFGFSQTEVAAFASAMISAGAESDVAATSFANMGRALTAGESAVKRQRDGLESLGLEATDVARRMQEDAVGTTIDVMERIAALPAEMQAAVSSDVFGNEARALGPLLTNLDLVRESVGLVADETLYAGSAFREFEVRNRIAASRLQRFRNAITQLSIVTGEALLPGLIATMDAIQPIIVAMSDWAEANPEVIAQVIQITAALVGLRIGLLALRLLGLTGANGLLWVIGNSLLSIGRTAAAVQGAVTQSLALQRALAALSGVPMGRLDALRATLVALARLTGLSAVAGAVSGVVAAIGTISLPVWAGVAAVVLAIAAAGAAVWRYWDRLSAIFEGVGLAIQDQLRPALDYLATIQMPQTLVGFFDRFGSAARGSAREAMAAWDALSAWMGGLDFSREILSEDDRAQIVANARDLVNQIVTAITALGDRLNAAGVAAIGRFLDGLQAAGAGVLSWAQGWAQSVADAIVKPIADAMESAYGGGAPAPDEPGGTDAMGNPTGRAFGGPMQPFRPYMTGEQGRELIFPGQEAYAATAAQTRRILAATRIATPRAMSVASAGARAPASPARMGPTTVNFGDIIIPGGANASAEDLAREFGRQVETQLRSHYSDAQ